MLKKSNKIGFLQGLTLVEIIISMVIFTLVLTGITNLFISGKKIILHSFYLIGAGQLGRLFLDPLQMQVRQDSWGTAANDLTYGTRYCDGDVSHTPQTQSCPSVAERTLGGRVFSAQYGIYGFGAGNELRRVKVTINWPES